MEKVNYTTTDVSFVNLHESSAYGVGEHPHYDIVAVYTDGIAGLPIIGSSNVYSLTIRFEKKAQAEDCLSKYEKGLPFEVVGLTVQLPDGVQHRGFETDTWEACRFVRLACPKGSEEQMARKKMAQVLRLCKDGSNEYWRMVELQMNDRITYEKIPVKFVEAAKSATYGENGSYDLVLRFADNSFGLILLGVSNVYCMTVKCTSEDAAEKGLSCARVREWSDVVGLDIQMPAGLYRNVHGSKVAVTTLRVACLEAEAEATAAKRFNAVLSLARNPNIDDWGIEE